MKNILITGGHGILGSRLIRLLSKKKYNLFILERKLKKKKILSLELPTTIKTIYGDFKDENKISEIIKKKKINFIFHLGAITQVIDAYKSPYETYKTNIMGTINILDAVRKQNKNIPIIYSSSDKAYGEMEKNSYKENDRLEGIFPYDVSKSASDLIAQSYSNTYNLKIGIIRSGNIYGPGDFNLDRLVPNLIVDALKNRNIKLRTNGKLRRDYIYVDDIAMGYLKLMNLMLKKNKKLLIYNLGSEVNLNALELVRKVYKIMKKNSLKPQIKKKFNKIEILSQKLDYKKAKKDLKWQPNFSFEKGMLETINWYKKNLHLFK